MENILNNIVKYGIELNKNINLGFKRNIYLSRILKYLDNRLVKVLVGQRRCGKSYILRQIINYLIDQKGINPKNIFYLNKEFIGFEGIKTSNDLNNVFLAYVKKFDLKNKVYIFLDEIQNISNWELFVNSYSQDFTTEIEIFITGSNSNLLSGELATYLSGRFIEFNIYPFSYSEYVELHKIKKNKTTYLEFLKTGGLPELINFYDYEVSRNYVESLKSTIILRDIISKNSIKDVELLESLFKFLITNIGNLTSLSNIVKYFKNFNKKTNYETLSSYTNYLLETFVIHAVERYDIRGKQTLTGVKKYYLNDLSFKNYLFGFKATDIGYNLENQIFNTLLQNDYKIYIGEFKNSEIDFVATKNSETLYLQVTYLLANQEVIDREFGNLEKINDNYPKYVVSLDDIKFSNQKGIIHYRPWELDF